MPKPVRAKPRRSYFPKVGYCFFCKDGSLPDWKKPEVLLRFISERGKIMAAERTGLCPKHQRKSSLAIKRGRFLGLLPYVSGVR